MIYKIKYKLWIIPELFFAVLFLGKERGRNSKHYMTNIIDKKSRYNYNRFIKNLGGRDNDYWI